MPTSWEQTIAMVVAIAEDKQASDGDYSTLLEGLTDLVVLAQRHAGTLLMAGVVQEGDDPGGHKKSAAASCVALAASALRLAEQAMRKANEQPTNH